MIVVPALLLSMPEIGANGARATALAMACVTSLRSIQLYLKERSVETSMAPWIAAGAFTGAFAGVQFAHQPGVSAIGQKVFAFILLVTAVRFGKDAFGSELDDQGPQGGAGAGPSEGGSRDASPDPALGDSRP